MWYCHYNFYSPVCSHLQYASVQFVIAIIAYIVFFIDLTTRVQGVLALDIFGVALLLLQDNAIL